MCLTVATTSSFCQIGYVSCLYIHKITGLLHHVSALTISVIAARGVCIDENPELINNTDTRSILKGIDTLWLLYDFNDNQEEPASQRISHLAGRLCFHLSGDLAIHDKDGTADTYTVVYEQCSFMLPQILSRIFYTNKACFFTRVLIVYDETSQGRDIGLRKIVKARIEEF